MQNPKNITKQKIDEEKLRKIGFDRVTARTLISLSSGEEKTSFQIEREMELRQPDVSIAIKKIRQMNALTIHEARRNPGKGRPQKFYKLSVPVSHIIELQADKKMSELKSIIENTRLLIKATNLQIEEFKGQEQ